MKNLIAIALVVFTLNAMAQNQRKNRSDRQAGYETMKQMTPNERADLQSKKLTLRLDLSDAQQQKVQAIVLKHAKANENNRKTWRSSVDASDTKPTQAEVLKMRNNRLDQQIEMKREMKAILTPEQYDKFEKIQASTAYNRNKQRGQFQKKQ